MTILSACQEAAVKLNQPRPSSIFSSTDAFALELALAANETAEAIVSGYEWQVLQTLATMIGDGTTTAFDLPADYNRMLKKGFVHSATWQMAAFRAARDLDDWLFVNDTDLRGSPGNWIIFGGQFQVFPAMATGETARFYYISNRVVSPVTGTNKSSFTLDTDSLRLPEKLLRLGIVWRWRANKGRPYAEDLQNFELAMSEVYGGDKGSKVLAVGRVRCPAGVSMAYPGTITP